MKFFLNVGSVVLAVGACAPVLNVSPTVRISVDFSTEQSSELAASLTATSAEGLEEFPILSAQSAPAPSLCLVVNVTGSGIPNYFAQMSGERCDRSFPGLGFTTNTFSWGDKVSIDSVGYGKRRFDLVGIPRSFFGGSCPSSLGVAQAGTVMQLVADGVNYAFPPSASGWVHLGTQYLEIIPGSNQVSLSVEEFAGALVGRSYDCASYGTFPQPSVQGFVETYSRSTFLDARCPDTADSIRVLSQDNKLVASQACDPKTQRAFIPEIPVSDYEYKAGQAGWFFPRFFVGAYMGSLKLAGSTLRLKPKTGMLFSPVSDVAGNEWRMPGSQVSAGSLVSGDTNKIELSLTHDVLGQRRVELGMSGWGLWDGHDASESVGDAEDAARADQVVRFGVLAKIDGAGMVGVESCQNQVCSEGLELSALGPVSGVELVGAAQAPKLISFTINGGVLLRNFLSLMPGTSTGDAFASVASSQPQPWGDQDRSFFPKATFSDLYVVRSQGGSDRRRGSGFEARAQLLLAARGVAEDDPEKTLIYRSPDSGRNWYLVASLADDAEVLDLQAITHDGLRLFVILSRHSDGSLRLLVESATSLGF